MIKKDGAVTRLTSYIVTLVVVFILLSPNQGWALSITRENVIDLTNKSRLENGAPAVIEHPALTEAAQNKANDMIDRQYWAHYYNGEKPWDWMKDAGYKYIQAGENLAIDFTDVEVMNQAWLDSESHRKNMLNDKYQHIGIGIASGWFEDHNTIIVVQMFGKTDEEFKPESVNSSQIEVSGDSLELENDSSLEDSTSLIDNFKNSLSYIGEKASQVFGTLGQASSSLASWLGDSIASGYRVFAD